MWISKEGMEGGMEGEERLTSALSGSETRCLESEISANLQTSSLVSSRAQ